jgi:hypothetical protein
LLVDPVPENQWSFDELERSLRTARPAGNYSAKVQHAAQNALVYLHALDLRQKELYRPPTTDPLLHEYPTIRDNELGSLDVQEGQTPSASPRMARALPVEKSVAIVTRPKNSQRELQK